ncbi:MULTISPECIES: hypothetical protein [unclassified Microbacterium]|uniref:hypothetical protein n=1 Tax=Microbacterium TaxID=33882 RepID=UPI003BA3D1CB
MTWIEWTLVALIAAPIVGGFIWVLVRERRSASLPGDEQPLAEDVRTKYDVDIARIRASQGYTGGTGANAGGGV